MKQTPLKPAAFYILLGLAEGEKHGYALLKDVERRSGSDVKLSASTLYTAIQRLEGKGLIAESRHRPDPALDDERRRYFRLTEEGETALRSEVRRLESAVDRARSVSGLWSANAAEADGV